MKTVTLYEITQREVEQVNGFAFMRSASVRGPACLLDDGDVLLGVEQLPLGHVTVRSDGSYIVLAPELHAILVEPIQAAAKLDIFAGQALAIEYFTGGPWWRRVWRALCKIPPA